MDKTTTQISYQYPEIFIQDIGLKNKIIHRGILSPNQQTFYFTSSNKDFSEFNIHEMRKIGDEWSKPSIAFFNSEFDDHGMSFSPDGHSILFSSTRPVSGVKTPSTWQLWMVRKENNQWSRPMHVDIPNLRNKLVSHPSISSNETIYFHASNLDYSEMNIFRSKKVHRMYEDAQLLEIPSFHDVGKCTPYISPDEKFLLFATIGDQLDLFISFNNGNDSWSEPKKLNGLINNLGQGNPSVHADLSALFYTAIDTKTKEWNVMHVNMNNIY